MIALGTPDPLRAPQADENPADVLIDAMLMAIEFAQGILDDEQPADELEAAEPPLIQAVLDESGRPIAAIRLDRDPGTRLFSITLLPADAGAAPQGPAA